MSKGPEKYGQFYWCIKTSISENEEIYVHANEARIGPGGSLILLGQKDEKRGAEVINLAIAPGQWTAMYAASCIDGHAVAVEHWKGEVTSGT